MPTCHIGPSCIGCAGCDPGYHAKRAAKRARQLRTVQEKNVSTYPVPDPYAAEIAEIRKARETPMSRFEERFAAERTAEFEKQHTEFATFRAAQSTPPRLTAAELKKWAPVDPYGPALAELRALRAKEGR